MTFTGLLLAASAAALAFVDLGARRTAVALLGAAAGGVVAAVLTRGRDALGEVAVLGLPLGIGLADWALGYTRLPLWSTTLRQDLALGAAVLGAGVALLAGMLDGLRRGALPGGGTGGGAQALVLLAAMVFASVLAYALVV